MSISSVEMSFPSQSAQWSAQPGLIPTYPLGTPKNMFWLPFEQPLCMERRMLLTPDEGAWACSVLFDQASSSFEESHAKCNNRTPDTHIYIVIRRAKADKHVVIAA